MKNRIQLAALSCALIASSASAEVVLNGFASIVAGQAYIDEEFDQLGNENLFQGYNDTINFKQDSLFALQASSDLGDGFGVTAQILAKGEDEFEPKFTWAYVSYDFNDSLRLLAGRQRAPFYMYSDFLDVSYAYPWISPPTGTYDELPVDVFDGLGLMYDFSIGSVNADIHLIYGNTLAHAEVFKEKVEGEFNGIFGGAFTVNVDWLTLRAAYFMGEGSLPFGEQSLGNKILQDWQDHSIKGMTGAAEMVDAFEMKDDETTFAELGFQMDFDNFILSGEYTRLELSDSFVSIRDSYYVMGGFRFSDFLLHATYGASDAPATDLISLFEMPTTLTQEQAESLPALLYSTNYISQAAAKDSFYTTVGLRWDFHDSAALKFEYTDFQADSLSEVDAGLFRTAIVTVF